MVLTRNYSPNTFSNYISHWEDDPRYAASSWMELHKHESISGEKQWVIIPTNICCKEAVVVVYDKCFKIIKPKVGEPISFNHKLLHALLPLPVAKYLEGKKRKTKHYLEWEKYHTHLCIEQRKSWDTPVMEWRFVE